MFKYVQILILAILTSFLAATSHAGTPISLYRSFGGNLNFVGTGGTLRTQPNTVDTCTVTNSNSATLSGMPATATVRAAYLYWAGSYSTAAGSTRTAPDYTITFESQSLTADRSFTETFNYNGTDYDFFSGFKDVTTIVDAKGNGTYTFSDLSVNSATPHCAAQAVVAGWSMLVIYEDAGENLRMINVFDGFQYYRGSQINLVANNFRIPSSNIDGKHGHISWEGDVENSAPLNGFTENLVLNGNSLYDTYSPLNNQFNSTINFLGSSTTYGVDFDSYDISPYLSPGDTSATTVYSSGGDLVLLSAEILSVTNTPIADLEITKIHSGDFQLNGNGSFNIVVRNNGPSDETDVIMVTDTLPPGLTYVSSSGTGWSVDTSADPTITWTHNGPLLSGQSLPTLTVTVLAGPAAVPSVDNTATVSSPTFDHVAGNDSSTDTVTVTRPDVSTSIKTVVDLNGGDTEPGDMLRYTIELIESGGQTANNVSVTDDIPAYVTNFTVVSIPGGAVNNSTGTGTGTNGNGYLDISGITVSANTSVTILFEVQVSGSTSTGDTISNIATVDNPDGPGATPAAPDVVVNQSQIPASGNKQLYFGAPDNENNPSLPQDLSRVPLSSEPSPNRIRIRRQDTPVTWALTPVSQALLSLNADISVVLQLRRNLQPQDRTIRLTLDYTGSASGTLGTVDVVIPGNGAGGLSNTVTRSFTFTVPTSSIVLPAGTQIRLTVDNSPFGGFGRDIYVYPYDIATGNTSRLELDAATVINVDSVEIYDDAFSGGSLITDATPGDTVYIRTVVSDPFGSFDITGAIIDIIDPNGTTVVSGAAVTQVADSGADTKIYEYPYTFPLAGPSGIWTTRITANEGTEGAISHTGIETISVVQPVPDIIMLKSVQIISDPINNNTNPKAIPGAQMLYRIQVTNQGTGAVDADTVEIIDPVPINTELYVGDDTSSPVTFIDGATSSGLTFTFTSLSSTTDDISFSDDGGTTFTYSPAPIGYDSNVTHILINPKQSFNGASGGNTPGFEIRFRVRVE